MPVYTVHAPVADGTDPRSVTDRFVFVRDGFHFWAFVFGPLWLAWHRLWLALIGYIAVWIGVAVALTLLHASAGTRFAVTLLIALLNDTDPEVRQMAAFALGLIGDRSTRDPLIAALSDQSLLVQGSAARALGLLGDPAAAQAVGGALAQFVQAGVLSELPPDADEPAPDTRPW